MFQEHFSPAVLRRTDGEALLRLMHGREDNESRGLMYWLEFKNDDQFAGPRFGSIAGGSALKFGLYQRQSDGSWVTGSPTNQKVIDVSEAVELVREQRNELVAGADVLDKMPSDDSGDAAYASLQQQLERVAPKLADSGWAHKYWFLSRRSRNQEGSSIEEESGSCRGHHEHAAGRALR